MSFRSGSVSMSQREILMGVTIEINEIIIKVQTQPPKDKINWNPQLHINMKKILVQSTNAAGEVFSRHFFLRKFKPAGRRAIQNESCRSERTKYHEII